MRPPPQLEATVCKHVPTQFFQHNQFALRVGQAQNKLPHFHANMHIEQSSYLPFSYSAAVQLFMM
jgi:hypothetical protein